jgi:hypothetical protein
MVATPAELAVAYGQGARDTIMMLATLPASDRDELLSAARKDRDDERFILCDARKHYLVRTEHKVPCPYCEWTSDRIMADGPDPSDYVHEPDTRVNISGSVPISEVNPRPEGQEDF